MRWLKICHHTMIPLLSVEVNVKEVWRSSRCSRMLKKEYARHNWHRLDSTHMCVKGRKEREKNVWWNFKNMNIWLWKCILPVFCCSLPHASSTYPVSFARKVFSDETWTFQLYVWVCESNHVSLLSDITKKVKKASCRWNLLTLSQRPLHSRFRCGDFGDTISLRKLMELGSSFEIGSKLSERQAIKNLSYEHIKNHWIFQFVLKYWTICWTLKIC